jgi:hypothetical protein
LRDAAVFAGAPRRAETAALLAAGLRAVVVFFAAARIGVFTLFAAALRVLDAGLATGLRAAVVFGAARFAGARRVDALTAIARVRGVDPVSPVLSLLTASLLLSR